MALLAATGLTGCTAGGMAVGGAAAAGVGAWKREREREMQFWEANQQQPEFRVLCHSCVLGVSCFW